MSDRRQELAAKMRADYKPLDPAKMSPEDELGVLGDRLIPTSGKTVN